MAVFSWTAVIVIGAALGGFTTYAAVLGGIGALTGGRFDRCARCGRHGLTVGGTVHPDGCPGHHRRVQLRAVWHHPHGLHLGSH